MKRKQIAQWISMIGMSSLTTIAFAQTTAPQQPNTLLQIVTQAVESHPEISARFHDFASALEDQNTARGGLRPQITLQGWLGQEWRSHFPAGSQPFPYQGAESYDFTRPGWSLSLRQMLFDGFATSNTVDQMGLEKLSKFYDLIATTDSLANDAVAAYLDVQRYTITTRLAQDNYNVHENTYKLLQERSQSGVGRGVDLEQAYGRLNLAQTNLLTEGNNLNTVMQRYRRVTGSFPPSDLAAVPDVSDKLPNPDTVKNFDDSIRHNPTMLSKQALIQAAEVSRKVAKAAYSPRLDLLLSTGRDRSEPYEPYRDLQSSSAQLMMTYQLYHGGADQSRVRQTADQTYAAVDVRDYTCRNVLQDLSTTWVNVMRLRSQMPFLREHELSTAKVRQAYQQQFQIGERTLLDVLNTENELFDARRALINAQYDLKINEYQWLMLSGRILEALGVNNPHSVDSPDEKNGFALPDEALRNCSGAPIIANLVQPKPTQADAAPMPAPKTVLTDKPITISGTNFAFDSAVLLPTADQHLNQVLQAAKDYTDMKLTVNGHTDSVGRHDYNQRLSERRAQSVKAWLVNRGVTADRITTAGYAETQPIADNGTAEGRASNRRVEIYYVIRKAETH